MKKGYSFPKSGGFSGSTGKVSQVRGYSRAKPVKKAMGGAVGPPPVGRSGPKMVPQMAPRAIPRVAPRIPPVAPRRSLPVRGGIPAAYADGGMVKSTIGDQGNSVTERDRPVTQFDSEHGGRSALAPGFKKGGFNRKPMFGKK